MKGKWLVTASLLVAFLVGFAPSLLHAQGVGKTFTLVYSNNINGEIDPCPT